MPQYLLSVHNVEGEEVPTEAEFRQSFEDTGVLNEELRSAGAWVFAGGLDADVAATERLFLLSAALRPWLRDP